MHSYCSNSVYLHTFVRTDVSIFWLKCAKLSTFIFYKFLQSLMRLLLDHSYQEL